MKTYILKRILLMVPTLIGITLLTYLIVRMAPGDPIKAMLRPESGTLDSATMQIKEDEMRKRYGLTQHDWTGDGKITTVDKFISAFPGYGRWIWHLVTGDLGKSIKYNLNPLELFAERIGITISLNVISMVFIFAVALPIGLVSARHRGSIFDRGASVFLLVLYSVPAILAGTLLLGFLCQGGLGWEVFPIRGLHSDGYQNMGWFEYLTDLLWHVAMPIVCMVYGGLAYLAKLGRASLLETLQMDYIRTARAKGLPEHRVVYVHGLRNSMLPMITVMVMTLPGLIGGSVIVETIFSIEGMGRLMVMSARTYDLPVIMTGTVIFGALTLIAILIGDILYAWADPRVRFQ